MKKRRTDYLFRLLVLLTSLAVLALTGCERTAPSVETVPSETVLPETAPSGEEAAEQPGEFYVSVGGDDANDGSRDHPFATPARAASAIHTLREAGFAGGVTVNIAPGEYRVGEIAFSAEDGGPSPDEAVVFRGTGATSGDVILNAAVSLDPALFTSVTDGAIRARFDPAVVDRIAVFDLTDAGLTPEEIAGPFATGSGNQAPAEYRGTNLVVYAGDTQLDLARYPNTVHQFEDAAYLKIGEGSILDPGVKKQTPGTIRLDDETAARVSRWATTEGAWVWAAFMHTWATESTPVSSFDPATGGLTFAFPSYDGYREGASFYFYNVPEELDAPGEYWIDREAMLLYLLPTETDGLGSVSVAVGNESMFTGVMNNMTFENMTFTGSRKSLFIPDEANYLTVRNCTLKNTGQCAFITSGNHNTVADCRIFNVALPWRIEASGDAATLTPGCNVFENNVVHDIEYAVGSNGVGDIVRHNEIYNASNAALTCGELNHLIEWNYVHEAVMNCDDGGAFYGGQRLHTEGNVLRYNKFENIGSDRFEGGAVAIYFDDGLSGMTATSNVIINAPCGVLCGGGRDLTVTNNLFIGCSTAVSYDERMVILYEEGREDMADPEKNVRWQLLQLYPYREDPWASAFPNLARIHFDRERADDIDFAMNPSYSVIENNIIIGEKTKWLLFFADTVPLYSTVGHNYINPRLESTFVEGTYELTKVAQRDKELVYEPIPYEGFGPVTDP